MKLFRNFIFSYAIVISQVFANPDIPADPGVPSVPGEDEYRSAREDLEEQIGEGTTTIDDVNEIRELITNSEGTLDSILIVPQERRKVSLMKWEKCLLQISF